MARKLKGALILLVVGLLVPAAAFAAGPTTTTTSTTTTTTSTTTPTPPPPKPKRGSVHIYLPDAFFVHKDALSIPGRGLHVNGVVTPYVPDQRVTLVAYLGHKKFKTVSLRLKPSKNRHFGYFSYRIVSRGTGTVRLQVIHARNAQMLGFIGRRSFQSLDTNVSFGSTGRFVQLVQQRLAALHFYVPQSGVYDGGTGLAIDAYHRLLGWGTSQSLNGRTISFLLNGWGEFKVKFPSHGHHAEGNISRQLLALIDGKQVRYIFPISSGKPSTPTILGDFHIYRRVPGYLPDGMYYSSFFIGGYAIHGYNPAPDYPASHGCMRLPISDAIFVYNWLNMGDWVDTYYEH
jgi:hypothetical protein